MEPIKVLVIAWINLAVGTLADLEFRLAFTFQLVHCFPYLRAGGVFLIMIPKLVSGNEVTKEDFL